MRVNELRASGPNGCRTRAETPPMQRITCASAKYAPGYAAPADFWKSGILSVIAPPSSAASFVTDRN
jgi:hypothetical protein